MNGLVLKNIRRDFGGTPVLKGISFAFPKKGLFGILGPSGCGKSTLLNILSLIDDDYEGEVAFPLRSLKGKSEEKRAEYRLKNIGRVFQDCSLLNLESSFSNVAVVTDSLYEGNPKLKKQKALDLLRFVGLEQKQNQTVNSLSGGERQRVAIARAIANDPKILLCDEPTGALDEANSHRVFALLQRIAKNCLVLVVSHDDALTFRYCDVVLKMKEGRIEETFQNPKKEKIKDPPASVLLKKKEGRPRLSVSFLFRHSFHLMKEKKGRAFLSEICIGFGLLGLGLSFFVSDTITKEIDFAFSSIVPPDCVILSPNNESQSPITNVYGALEEEAQYLASSYPDLVKGYGLNLVMDYESVFCDDNSFTAISGATSALLPGFSCRSINDFLWLEDAQTKTFYPSRPLLLDWSEVCLGLPMATMANLCYSFGIARNFQSLGDFIAGKDLFLLLSLAHSEWDFADEELFRVKAVTYSEYPCFFHSDPLWNRRIILQQLHFFSTNIEANQGQQNVFQLPYLELNGSPSELISLLRKDPSVDHLVFEQSSYRYLPTVCPIGERCEIPRLYLYGADKAGVGWNQLDEAMRLCPKIKGRLPSTSGSFFASSSNILSGFPNKTFFTSKESELDVLIDTYSDLKKEEADLPLTLPEQTVDGCLLTSGTSALRLSSDLSSVSGTPPKAVDEVALSSSLMKRWGDPKTIYVLAETQKDEMGDKVVRTFEKAQIKVTGVVENGHDTLYVRSDWTVDFFADCLGMSSFALEPTGAMFSFANEEDALESLELLAKHFPSFRFSSPSKEVGESIADTVEYLGTVIFAFSIVSLLMSILLFSLVMVITIKENASEGRMLYILGIGAKDIARNYRCTTLLYLSASLLSAFAVMAVSQIAVKVFVAESFGVAPSFSLSLSPFLAMASAALTLFFVTGVVCGHYARKNVEKV